jgi:hypothetical protein
MIYKQRHTKISCKLEDIKQIKKSMVYHINSGRKRTSYKTRQEQIHEMIYILCRDEQEKSEAAQGCRFL